ncbi:MAG: hypothetical protein NTZ44_02285 [Candidatus Nomurabacteria bacterium]|nr:hypothetical protein [Candidatus Nomurabacteria bacterium]
MKYEVLFEPFTERHYIRTFAKKYKSAWDLTSSLIREELEQIDILFLKSIAEHITDRQADIVICKTEFKIAGTQISRHASGNRCIVAMHKKTNQVKVLLVYYKNDLGGGSETGNWIRLIKENYKEYAHLL